jgi:hypothetical protein
MFRKFLLAACLAVFLLVPVVNAQTAEVTITLNEQFFDALLDAMFEHGGLPEISIAGTRNSTREQRASMASGFTSSSHSIGTGNSALPCTETIKLLRENQDVKTAVRFRAGRIYMPIAFSGNYNPPLVGCVDFSGYAESNVDLEFDRQTQRLIGKVRVLNVCLNGTAGLGSSVLTRMVQSSIDKKMNPFEIIRADKLSFTLPVQNSTVRMEATGIRSEIANNSLLIHVDYSFPK